MGEEFAASTIAALDFIADEYGVVFVAERAQFLHELLGDATNATYTLNALNNDGAHITFLDFLLPRLNIVDRQIGHMTVIVDGGDDFGIVGHFDSQRCTSVKCFLHRQHTCPAVVERC